MPLPKGSGTSIMETFSLELPHNIMLTNKCLYCRPVVAPTHFSLGGNWARIYWNVHVRIQKTYQKSKRTISYNTNGYRLFLIKTVLIR